MNVFILRTNEITWNAIPRPYLSQSSVSNNFLEPCQSLQAINMAGFYFKTLFIYNKKIVVNINNLVSMVLQYELKYYEGMVSPHAFAKSNN